MRQLYWIKQGLIVALVSLVGALAYTLLSLTQVISLQSELSSGAGYALAFGSIINMAMGISLYLIYIPLAISFGATRKEALIGVQLFRIAMSLPLLAVSGILIAIVRPEYADFALLAGTAAFLAFAGLGGAVGTLATKFNQRILLLLCFGLLILLLTVSGVACYLLISRLGLQISIGWGLLGLGAAIYAVCSTIEAKAIKNFCVR